MSYRLKTPWVDEDPEDLPGGMVLVERVAFDQDQRLVLQGRVVKADGQRGKVRTFIPVAGHIASLLRAHVTGSRSGVFYARDDENPWKELHAALQPPDHG